MTYTMIDFVLLFFFDIERKDTVSTTTNVNVSPVCTLPLTQDLWLNNLSIYLPKRFLRARVRFRNFLCLCLFIFKRRFRSVLVSCMPSSTRGDWIGCCTVGAGGAEKGRRVARCSVTLSTTVTLPRTESVLVHTVEHTLPGFIYLVKRSRGMKWGSGNVQWWKPIV